MDNRPDVNKIRKEITDFWKDNKIFEKSVEQNKENEMVFYDGPPFPTATPHWGTVIVSYIKDMIARYHTMQGKSVPRVWGWDCHGLPIEEKVEKQLGITDKTEIENKLGIAAFNTECKNFVNNANDAWKKYITNMARWVDYENSYKTMDKNFMESVIWAFKTCFDKGLIYKDYRVSPYCTRCQTTLSVSDTRETDSTRPRQDKFVMVKFETDETIDNLPVFYITWTTTPWTLFSNMALAVGKNFEYAYVKVENQVFVVCKDCVKNFEKVFGKEPQILKVCKGDELVGKRYKPLFSNFEHLKDSGAFKIIAADFVGNEEGVGIVHTAPAFGEDDYWACKKNGVPLVNPVDEKGCFTKEVSQFEGRQVIEANADVIRHLKELGSYVLDGTIVHNYPHCWRCREPLIYKAVDAWYLNIEKLKPRLIELNKQINWVPDTVKNGRFLNWLENARDWNLSRNRYWSTPIPVWECDCCDHREVLGSVEEIKQKSGVELDDLHRQYMDEIKYKCSKCGGTMKRTPEVLDGWFESGSVPYAQAHYPFENKEWFENHYPCDFIVEYTGQIRCWFYYLHVLATALFDKPSFKNCVVHGTILAKDGKKMSKSLKNYTDPFEIMERYGSDAVRLYLFNSNAMLLNDFSFNDDGAKEPLQKILLPLYNCASFFKSYAEIDGFVGDVDVVPSSNNPLDHWMLGKLFETEKTIKNAMDKYQIDDYVKHIYILVDGMTNWYIRRSRRRFWASGFEDDKKSAYQTLFYSLVSICKICAPVMPIWSEKIFKELTGRTSVHLEKWADIPKCFENKTLTDEIDLVQDTIVLARAIRNENNVKNRQPLSKMQLAFSSISNLDVAKKYEDILKEELNVKQIEFIDNADEIAVCSYLPNFNSLKKYDNMADKIKIIKGGKISVSGNGYVVEFNGERFDFEQEDLLVSYKAKADAPVKSNGKIVVSINLEITNKLKQEGVAREMIRNIQDSRKELDCEITEKILLSFEGDYPTEWVSHIENETLGKVVSLQEFDLENKLETENGVVVIKIKRQ